MQIDIQTDIIVQLKQMNAHMMAQQATANKLITSFWARWTVETRLQLLLFGSNPSFDYRQAI